MGENKELKYVLISGLDTNDTNRGTAALGYGSLVFLLEKGYLKNGQKVLVTFPYGNPLNKSNFIDREETILQGEQSFTIVYRSIWKLEHQLLRWNIKLPFSKLCRLMKNVEMVAAINGGDGFSDIYGSSIFFQRLYDTYAAIAYKLPLVILPQTLGPFKTDSNFKTATDILKYAKKVFVRDECFVKELGQMNIFFEKTKDLSYFMKPQAWDIDIKPNAVGLNVSGLAYENNFGPLSGQFTAYPLLMRKIVSYFQQEGVTVYLIPHSYDYDYPRPSNDDLYSSRSFYHSLENKNHVVLVNKNLISPQVKYLISKMSFFIGTRMHANFAAIYTKVPLFGLAYSYKFKGAFEAHGIYNRTAMINNLKETEVDNMVSRIVESYKESINH